LSRDLPGTGSNGYLLAVSDTPRSPGLLPVPGRSRDKPRSYS